jgi:hypothetical protein
LPDGTHAVEFLLESDFYADPVAQYRKDGDWKAGVRPPNVIERLDDIEWILKNGDSPRPRVVCRYCGVDRAIRTLAEGERWFVTHPCDGEGIDIKEWLAA